ncbi:helix-turn-helix domain-containing protein [Bacilliculturomica massiliensis]|uniref:helix-turn-helix domain-containing protein n=1 Tax=Bacilliculturomica massiliensis TaxID=1917867 RepID=UPI0013EF1944|nr:helix-turn-helix transcriptional regulator [Bacilliculturomica massiliensis]
MTAQRIKDIMKQKKMGNKALAESSGVPLGTLNKILYGETTNPSLDTMRAIASVLECSLDEFIDDLSDGAGTAGERDDLTEYLDELHKRPELKTLFSVAKNASREDVEKAVKIIEMFSNNNSDDI